MGDNNDINIPLGRVSVNNVTNNHVFDDRAKDTRKHLLSFSSDEVSAFDGDKAHQTTSTSQHFPLGSDNLPPATLFPQDDSGFSSRVSVQDGSSLCRGDAIIYNGLKSTEVEVVIAQDCPKFDEKDDGSGDTCSGTGNVLKACIKLVGVFGFLYLFICSLDLLSSAFRLLGGKAAGNIFSESDLLHNPITGLMIGVLSTVLLQSSSTSTSIVITMVSSGILEVRPAIPIVMGANIGTTVTNTIVSLAHSLDHREFRRAFSGATVHDVFNWLTVVILLPLEYFSGYLYHLTNVLVDLFHLNQLEAKNKDLLKRITKPLTKSIVQVDEKVITAIAEGKAAEHAQLNKVYCTYETIEKTVVHNVSLSNGTVVLSNGMETELIPLEKCPSLFSILGMNDTNSGAILLFLSLLMLSGCLYMMVKLLHSLLGLQVARVAKRTINANFPRPFAWLTDYVVLLIGAGLTVLVQSSSVFTSALTPLVGIGCLKLERMYPLTLGSNIGTTATGILAAFASSASTIQPAFQLALCHLFFNITGILIFFPVPTMRRIPLRIARFLGRTTADYRWFAVFYLVVMYLLFPGCLLALSYLVGDTVFIVIISIAAAGVLAAIAVNKVQGTRFKTYLPEKLQSWDWLPLCLRSLRPMDGALRSLLTLLARFCCCKARCRSLFQDDAVASTFNNDDSSDDSDDDDDDSTSPSCCCCCRCWSSRTLEIASR